MPSVLHVADYGVICVMMAISAGVGIYFRLTGGKQKTTLEFLMADRNMTVLPVTFSVLASSFSAISLLGAPGESYLYGTQMWIKEVFFSLAIVAVAYYILPLYFENDVKTIYEYLEKRFGKVTKFITSFFYVVQMILYMPVAIYAPSLALNMMTGISLWTCVISVAVVCTFYSTLGGLKAVLWTDLFQGLLMLLTAFALIIKGSLDSGGFYTLFKRAEAGQRLELFNTSTDFTVRYTFWNSMIHGLIGALYYTGTTFTVVQRLMSCGNVKRAQKSLLWSIPLSFIFQSAVCFLGLTMYSYFNACDPVSIKEVKSKDQLVPLFMMELFGHIPGLPGLCVAGILSAVLSTMSSVVNCLATVTLEDYIRPFMKSRKNLKESTAILLAKALAIFYGGLCLLLTFLIANAKGLIEASVLLLGIVGGPIFGIFYLGMFTTTANESGTLIGLFAGIAFTAWIGFGALYNKSKYPPLPLSTAGCTGNVSGISVYPMYGSNFTSVPEALNITRNFVVTHNEERYIFPLYKVSYLWFVVIGFISTAVVGYVASFIIEFNKPKKEVDPKHISPLVRKWLCKVPESHETKEYVKVPQILNQNAKSAETDEELLEQRSENI